MRSSPDMAGSSVPCTHGVGQLATEAGGIREERHRNPLWDGCGKGCVWGEDEVLELETRAPGSPQEGSDETTGWESPSQGSAGISLGPRLPAGGRGWMATVDSASVDCEGKALALQSQPTPASLRD